MALLYLDEVAANTWTLGQNLLDGENFEVDDWFRKVVRIGITGSSTIAGAMGNFTLKYGDRRVALLRPSRYEDIGVSQLDMIPINSRLVCRPSEPIMLIVEDASDTNPYNVLLDIKEIRPGRRR